MPPRQAWTSTRRSIRGSLAPFPPEGISVVFCLGGQRQEGKRARAGHEASEAAGQWLATSTVLYCTTGNLNRGERNTRLYDRVQLRLHSPGSFLPWILSCKSRHHLLVYSRQVDLNLCVPHSLHAPQQVCFATYHKPWRGVCPVSLALVVSTNPVWVREVKECSCFAQPHSTQPNMNMNSCAPLAALTCRAEEKQKPTQILFVEKKNDADRQTPASQPPRNV